MTASESRTVTAHGIFNIIANKLKLKGKEYATSNSFGSVDYCGASSEECSFSYGEDENVRYFYSFFKKHENEFEK